MKKAILFFAVFLCLGAIFKSSAAISKPLLLRKAHRLAMARGGRYSLPGLEKAGDLMILSFIS